MTIVAALYTPRGVWMGADSLASDDDLRISSSSPKVAKFANFLIGFAGSYGAGQKFFDAVKNDKTMTVKDLVAIRVPGSDWSLLVADSTGLYEMDSSRGLVRMKRRHGVSYGVIGSGSAVALGALYCWHEGRESLTTALKAAAEHTNRVKGPFKIVELGA